MRAYVLKRSGRRTLCVEITPDGTVLVRAPHRAPVSAIQRFLEEHEDWIRSHIALREREALAFPPLSPEQEAALRERARVLIPRRVAYFEGLMGVRAAGVRITSAQKRFGSCSARDSLCFSWRLMRYPPEAVDYVVAHELAHIRHKDHSAAFYAEIAAVMPDYRERIRLLRPR